MTALETGAAGAGDALASVRQSLTIGVRRAPLPRLAGPFEPLVDAAGDTPSPVALALTAIGARYSPLAPKTEGAAVRALPWPERPVPGPETRRHLRRLARLKDSGTRTLLAGAALDLMAARGAGVHPFDLPALDAMLKPHAERLGRVERAYFAFARGGGAAAPLLGIAVTAETWRDAWTGERIAFLKALRASDPGRARDLLDAGFDKDPPSVRAKLMTALAIGLNQADGPFLERASNDRAESVRKAVDDLLGRLPGTDAYRKRLADFAGRLKIETKGLMRRGRVLHWKRPEAAKGASAKDIARDCADGLRLSDISAALGETPGDLAKIKIVDDIVAAVLIRAALTEGLDGLIGDFAANTPERDGPSFVLAISDFVDTRTGAERLRLVRPLLDLSPVKFWPKDNQLVPLADALRAPLPEDLAGPLAASPEFAGFIEACVNAKDSHGHDGRQALHANLIQLAILMPPSEADRMREAIARIGGDAALAAGVFTDFQAALAAEPLIVYAKPA